MNNDVPEPLYAPTPAEKARQDFVLGVKLLANGPVQAAVRHAYAAEVEPAVERTLGRKPGSRGEVQRALAATVPFREWATLTHYSQSMMWDSVEPSARRAAEHASKLLAGLATGARKGSLELDPSVPVPEPALMWLTMASTMIPTPAALQRPTMSTNSARVPERLLARL